MKTSILMLSLVLAGSLAAQTTYDCHFGLGHSKGFWHNKNGKAVLSAHDTGWRYALTNLNLVDNEGNAYDVPAGAFDAAHEDFSAWIVGPAHGNMAYILSMQLAATVLNLEAGDIGTLTDPHVDWMGNKVLLTTVIADANTLLGLHPLTTEPSAERALQEEYKDLFDAINNNLMPVCEPVAPPPPPASASTTLSPTTGGGSGDDGSGCTTGIAVLPWGMIAAMGAAVASRRRRK